MVNQFIESILRFKIIPIVQIGVLCKHADKLEKNAHIYNCKGYFETLWSL